MRRCSEFRLLDSELRKDCPNINFPDMPQKKSFAISLTDEEIIVMRTQILQRYLNELIKQGLCEPMNPKIQRFITSNNFVPFYRVSVKKKGKDAAPIIAVPNASLANERDLYAPNSSIIGNGVLNTESLVKSPGKTSASIGIL